MLSYFLSFSFTLTFIFLFPLYFFFEYLNINNLKIFLKRNIFLLFFSFIFFPIWVNFLDFESFVSLLFFLVFSGAAIIEFMDNNGKNNRIFFTQIVVYFLTILFYFLIYLNKSEVSWVYLILLSLSTLIFNIVFNIFILVRTYLKKDIFIPYIKKFYILIIFIAINLSIPLCFYFYEFIANYDNYAVQIYKKAKKDRENIIFFNKNIDIFFYKGSVGYILKDNNKIINSEIVIEDKNNKSLKYIYDDKINTFILCIENNEKPSSINYIPVKNVDGSIEFNIMYKFNKYGKCEN